MALRYTAMTAMAAMQMESKNTGDFGMTLKDMSQRLDKFEELLKRDSSVNTPKVAKDAQSPSSSQDLPPPVSQESVLKNAEKTPIPGSVAPIASLAQMEDTSALFCK